MELTEEQLKQLATKTALFEKFRKAYTPKAGDEVVLFYCHSPITHNSKNNPEHSSRARIVRIKRTGTIVLDSNFEVKTDDMLDVLPVEQARKVYRLSFPKSMNAFQKQCVDNL